MAKLSHKDVEYGPGMPHCGVCTHYSEDESAKDEASEGHCKLVADPISEDGWCKLFKPKRKPTLAEGPAR
jgi:hypothetical protein